MRVLNKLILVALALGLSAFTMSNCAILKKGKFTYKTGKKNVYVEFNGTSHIEYHNDKKHTIKSTIEWINDCEYYLQVNETNYPNFPFKLGSKLHVKITKVDGKNIYYTSSIKNKKWEGKLTKME